MTMYLIFWIAWGHKTPPPIDFVEFAIDKQHEYSGPTSQKYIALGLYCVEARLPGGSDEQAIPLGFHRIIRNKVS